LHKEGIIICALLTGVPLSPSVAATEAEKLEKVKGLNEEERRRKPF
jgi:hypothetical protein